jgi:hypothetical protein
MRRKGFCAAVDGFNGLSRRDFIKYGGMTLAALSLPIGRDERRAAAFPDAERLCRVTEDTIKVYHRPDPESNVLGYKRFDDVLQVYCRVVGTGFHPHNHVWFETPEGFIWSAYAQPVRNQPNQLLSEIPAEGIWTEVTVPYIDSRTRADPMAPVVYRLYYAMILNVDRIEVGEDGEVWYRVYDENRVVMYAPGWAFRYMPPEELAPISPEIEDKAIRVRLIRQEMSAFEAGVEVFYCRISTGLYSRALERWHTPEGQWWTWRKMVSRHMAAGDAYSGFDLPGVGWTILFSSDGAAIHSTYWHNDYGTPRSHGCVNVRPEDGQWLFRWTTPVLDYKPGDLTMRWPDHGTKVIVEE